MYFSVTLDNYDKSKEVKIFKKNERKYKKCIKLIPNTKFSRTPIYLWVEFLKKSPKNREIVIYCPYLIINETKLPMKYQENSLTSSKPSMDNRVLYHYFFFSYFIKSLFF